MEEDIGIISDIEKEKDPDFDPEVFKNQWQQSLFFLKQSTSQCFFSSTVNVYKWYQQLYLVCFLLGHFEETFKQGKLFTSQFSLKTPEA